MGWTQDPFKAPEYRCRIGGGYAYAKDDRLTGITYTGAVNPTPNVSFTYDPYFPRLASMTDGTGTRQYA